MKIRKQNCDGKQVWPNKVKIGFLTLHRIQTIHKIIKININKYKISFPKLNYLNTLS